MKENKDKEIDIQDKGAARTGKETKDKPEKKTDSKSDKESGNRSKSRFVYSLISVIAAIVFVVSAAYIFNYLYSNYKSEKQFDDLRELVHEEDDKADTPGKENSDELEFVDIAGVMVQKKFEEIYMKNNDFIGWITIEDTKIDYPVMQTMASEEYYIDKDFDRKHNSAGTVFADTSSDIEKPSTNIILYGHNMKIGTMFNNILKYEDEEFYKDHKYISFDTIHGNGTYEVIAAFRTQIFEPESNYFKYYTFFEANTFEDLEYYVNNCKSLTPYEIDTTVEEGDTLLTLSTCAYHHEHGRYVLVAKKVNDN